MSSPRLPQQEIVFCHSCEDEWYKDDHGMTCPRCHSDFVEIIEGNDNPRQFLHDNAEDDDPPELAPEWRPFGGMGPMPGAFSNAGSNNTGFSFSTFPSQNADRGSPDGNSQTFTSSPRGGFFYSSTTVRYGQPPQTTSGGAQDLLSNFGTLFSGLLGAAGGNNSNNNTAPPTWPGAQGRTARSPGGQPDPVTNIMAQFFPPPGQTRAGPPGSTPENMPQLHHPLLGMMHMMLSANPTLAHGMFGSPDAAYSEHDFDRIMSQLLEQAQQGGGAPPAAQENIASIPKRKIVADDLNAETGKVDCSICMDEAKLGDEVSELWCSHWFHTECIEAWLGSHDTCPHCRKSIREGKEEYDAKAKRGEKRRRSSRTHSHSSQRSHNSNGGEGSSGGGLRERLSNFIRGSR